MHYASHQKALKEGRYYIRGPKKGNRHKQSKYLSDTFAEQTNFLYNEVTLTTSAKAEMTLPRVVRDLLIFAPS